MLRLVHFSICCTPTICLHTTRQMTILHDLLGLLFYPARSADGEPSQLAWLAFLPSEKCGWVTCYFGKHDRIAVGGASG